PRGGVWIDELRVAGDEPGVVAPHGADEDADAPPAQAEGIDPRVLQRLPGQLEDEALLGVHLRSLRGRDPEERRVEAVDLVEEAPPAGAHLPLRRGIFVEVVVEVPPFGRDLPDTAAPLAQQIPEPLRRSSSPREPAPDAHDGDGLVARAAPRAWRGCISRRGG